MASRQQWAVGIASLTLLLLLAANSLFFPSLLPRLFALSSGQDQGLSGALLSCVPMTAAQVQLWLQYHGLEAFAQQFAAHDLQGELLGEVTLQDLEDLGIDKLGDRKRVMSALQTLHPPLHAHWLPQPVHVAAAGANSSGASGDSTTCTLETLTAQALERAAGGGEEAEAETGWEQGGRTRMPKLRTGDSPRRLWTWLCAHGLAVQLHAADWQGVSVAAVLHASASASWHAKHNKAVDTLQRAVPHTDLRNTIVTGVCCVTQSPLCQPPAPQLTAVEPLHYALRVTLAAPEAQAGDISMCYVFTVPPTRVWRTAMSKHVSTVVRVGRLPPSADGAGYIVKAMFGSAQGLGTVSVFGSAVNPLGKPDPPDRVRDLKADMVETGGTLLVSFLPPADDGGQAPLKYVVEGFVSADPSKTVTVTHEVGKSNTGRVGGLELVDVSQGYVSASKAAAAQDDARIEVQLPGLRRFVAYTIRVIPYNDGGAGQADNIRSQVKMYDLPTMPFVLLVKPRHQERSIKVWLSAPTDTGGDMVQYYQVFVVPCFGGMSSTQVVQELKQQPQYKLDVLQSSSEDNYTKLEVLMEGLEHEHEYCVRALAANKLGRSLITPAWGPVVIQALRPHPPTKYLFFSPCYGQMNNQVVAYSKAAAVAHILKRTLVVPQMQLKEGHADQQPFEQFWDLDALSTVVPVVRFEEWWPTFQPKVQPNQFTCVKQQDHTAFGHWELPHTYQYIYGACWQWQSFPPTNDIPLQWLQERIEAAPHDPHMKHLWVDTELIWFDTIFGFPFDISPVMAAFLPTPKLRFEAENYVQKRGLYNYTAVHSRSSEGECIDRVLTKRYFYEGPIMKEKIELCDMHWDTVSRRRSAAKSKSPEVNKYLSDHIFLATDGSSPENDLSLVEHGAVQYDGSMKGWSEHVIIDMWVLVKAMYFVGNPASSLSANVCLLREAQRSFGRIAQDDSPELCNHYKWRDY